MSDDLDELDAALRRAMAALDGETPAGYFDALPGRTLARLEDPAIGELPGEPGRLRAVHGQPPPADGDRDDGHDDDGDDAVYASQVMPAIELPDPAEREAPVQRDRAASSSLFAVPAVAAVGDLAARPASAAATGPVEAPGAAPVSIAAGSHRRSRMRVAIAGIGVAAVAAVAAIYLTAASRGQRMERSAGSPRGTAASEATAAGTAAGSAAIAPADAGSAAQGSGSAVVPEPPGKPAVPLVKRPGKVKTVKGSSSKFDGELPDGTPRRAVGKKPTSDRLRSDRTALSGDDIERAMTAVAGQARACFAKTRGTAALRVTVAPTGQIVQVAVTGEFAGSPAAACVERAVRAVTFPAWDGPAQSFDYSYLLSD